MDVLSSQTSCFFIQPCTVNYIRLCYFLLCSAQERRRSVSFSEGGADPLVRSRRPRRLARSHEFDFVGGRAGPGGPARTRGSAPLPSQKSQLGKLNGIRAGAPALRGQLFMTAEDFRRMALELPDATESRHMAHPDFRVGEKFRYSRLSRRQMGRGQASARTTRVACQNPNPRCSYR